MLSGVYCWTVFERNVRLKVKISAYHNCCLEHLARSRERKVSAIDIVNIIPVPDGVAYNYYTQLVSVASV